MKPTIIAMTRRLGRLIPASAIMPRTDKIHKTRSTPPTILNGPGRILRAHATTISIRRSQSVIVRPLIENKIIFGRFI